ncbi:MULTISPECIES: DUF6976 family protein [unclassified Sphingomonas]|uniref:DUF6976 family protein n=1 Tax=unclassified Sphingomonas TaxID=196159 RepID=UPI0006F714A4|nr:MULTISPECIES: hypothetical protein [unclassified Sphingomonas]KQM57266.1 hypothetical protein ASE65_13170 [Sphingomonas sp. Leaf16]KQN10441.1 hypothetical protein ASE81_13215 [Sphingomonas sp. Leaf29]KQN18242.1 hypothetical protein ASE83_13150 [Sphingomonas sp. Leaf32]
MTGPNPHQADRSLYNVAEVAAMLAKGDTLILAAEEPLLAALPRGNWIGGTSPYFMTAEAGGTCDRDRIFVQRMPDIASVAWVGMLDRAALPDMATLGPDNGYTIVLIPGQSDVHRDFALGGLDWQDMFRRPVVGWVTGVAGDAAATDRPKVFDGRTGRSADDAAVVLHVALPDDAFARVDIVNLFVPDMDGPVLTFADDTGFSIEWVVVDGVRTRMVDHIAARGIDTRLPLVADYNGAMINVATAAIDAASGQISFFAPVHSGIEYRFARPIADYPEQFAAQLGSPRGEVAFSCNCILNYLYAGLEGRTLGSMAGPVTFGEIAYMLLTQTMVYLVIERD